MCSTPGNLINNLKHNFLSIIGILILVSCSSQKMDPAEDIPPVEQDSLACTFPLQLEDKIAQVAYTYPQENGNRLLPNAILIGDKVQSIPLDGRPTWVTGLHFNGRRFFFVVLETGDVQAWKLNDTGTWVTTDQKLGPLPVGMPPTFAMNDKGEPKLINTLCEMVSNISSPTLLSDGRLAYLNKEGDLIVQGQDGSTVLQVNALPDARILKDETDRLLLLSDPTSDYKHDVLGDGLEARSFSLIETQPTIRRITEVTMPSQAVIEGIAPIWVDFNGDGQKEIIVTLSNNADGSGARIVVFSEEGAILAQGPLSPGGWRHQLAVFAIEQGGEQYIVDIQKPHVQRIVNFYRLSGDQLEIVASRTGFSSHQLGSRNLDMALAGDFDGDQRQEILVPNQAYTQIHALSLQGSEVVNLWQWDMGSRLSTNIAGLEAGGQHFVAAGTTEQLLYIWGGN